MKFGRVGCEILTFAQLLFPDQHTDYPVKQTLTRMIPDLSQTLELVLLVFHIPFHDAV